MKFFIVGKILINSMASSSSSSSSLLRLQQYHISSKVLSEVLNYIIRVLPIYYGNNINFFIYENKRK